MRRSWLWLVVGVVTGLGTTGYAQVDVTGTLHDFSALTAPLGEAECFACHDGPVWNHELSTTTGYTVSTTTLSILGDPTGTSAECLACHEGNVAVENFGGASGGTTFITGDAAFGTDLTGHHPVSFTYDSLLATAHGGLKDPLTAASSLGGTIDQDMLESGRVQCTSCHDQHDDSLGNFLVKTGFSLCFTCHSFFAPDGDHHIPNRENPWGGAFSCTACHGENLGGPADGGFARACDVCHNDFEAPNAPPPGHHGNNRYDPLTECSGCHGPTLGGAPYGSVNTPSCNDCHGDVWIGVNRPPVVDPGGPYAGYVGTAVRFDASGTFDPDPADKLAYQWVFGDGNQSQFPSPGPTATHVFETPGTYNGWLSVTDGVRDPVLAPFVVEVTTAPPPPDADSWTVTTTAAPPELFTITIEDHAGVLVVIKDGGAGPPSLAFGIEFSSVIFWMDIWMDVSGNVFWGVGDTFFGNIDRGAGTMSGVLFDEGGGVATFSGRVNPDYSWRRRIGLLMS